MTADEKYEAARKAILAIFGDTSVVRVETVRSLEALASWIQDLLETLE